MTKNALPRSSARREDARAPRCGTIFRISSQDRRLFAEIDEVSAAIERSARYCERCEPECRTRGRRGGGDRSRSIEPSRDLFGRAPGAMKSGTAVAGELEERVIAL